MEQAGPPDAILRVWEPDPPCSLWPTASGLPLSVLRRLSVIPCFPRTVCATVEKVKHPARGKSFIPFGTRSCVIVGRCPRTEFRHDSCNTEHR